MKFVSCGSHSVHYQQQEYTLSLNLQMLTGQLKVSSVYYLAFLLQRLKQCNDLNVMNFHSVSFQ